MTAHFAALDALGHERHRVGVQRREPRSGTRRPTASWPPTAPSTPSPRRWSGRSRAPSPATRSRRRGTRTRRRSRSRTSPRRRPRRTITEVQLPARAYPSGFSVSLASGCYDATSLPGRLLVQPDARDRRRCPWRLPRSEPQGSLFEHLLQPRRDEADGAVPFDATLHLFSGGTAVRCGKREEGNELGDVARRRQPFVVAVEVEAEQIDVRERRVELAAFGRVMEALARLAPLRARRRRSRCASCRLPARGHRGRRRRRRRRQARR